MPQREARARYRERDRREIEAATGSARREVEEVADPRHDRADDDQRRLPAIRRREAAQPAHQRRGADQDQEVAVGRVHPVPRCRPCRRGDGPSGVATSVDRRPIEMVLLVGRRPAAASRPARSTRSTASEALGRPRDAAVIRREEQPQHADRRDAEVLELRNEDARLDSRRPSVCIALVKLHHATASIIQPNADAARHAAARPRRSPPPRSTDPWTRTARAACTVVGQNTRASLSTEVTVRAVDVHEVRMAKRALIEVRAGWDGCPLISGRLEGAVGEGRPGRPSVFQGLGSVLR